MRRALISLLFLLSGATALCYQVAWTRHLVLVFGNTTHAIALILGAYMLGLALGAEAGGRLADRSRRPVLWYAGFEAAIGVYALAFPLLLEAARALYRGLGTGAAPALFVGAFLLLVVPTFLMGTTLPLLVRGIVGVRGAASGPVGATATGRFVGLLYGVNTLGAVLGCAVTGFWLIESAGVLGSTRVAAAVNVLIGILGVALLRSQPDASTDPASTEGESAEPEPEPESMEGSSAAARAALVGACAGGFVGLAAEVVWTRLLVFFLQGFTYTFTAMLTVFLFGLAIGGLVVGRLAARIRRPELVLGRLQILGGVLAAGVLFALTRHHALTHTLWHQIGEWLAGSAGEGAQPSLRLHHGLTLLAASAVVLLPPTLLMGAGLPLAAMAFQRGAGDLGQRIGRLYAMNTLGAVAGSLTAGFILAPTVGMTWSAVFVALATVVSGVAVLLIAGERGLRPAVWAVAGGAVATGLCAAADPATPFLLRSHVFAGASARENVLRQTLEGVVCQVSVVENVREGYTLLYTDEFQAAGTKPEYRYMRMLAHLPVALAEDPSRVLVICWGTGTTCGSVSTHPEVTELDIVEISPEVMKVAHNFESANRGVLTGGGRADLDVRVHVDDGRNFVLRQEDTWGVITLEPLMPYTPAAIHFYTEDFYRECAPRLAPGGLMCQWVPLQGMSGEHFKQLVRSFVNVFPDSGLFFVDGAVALVGGNEPLSLQYRRVAERLASDAVKGDLAEVGYDDPARALGTFVASGDTLRAFAAESPAVTDEFPTLEFHPIPLGVALKHLWENLQSMRDLRASYEKLPVELDGTEESDVAARLFLALRAGKHALEGDVLIEGSTLLQRLDRNQQALDELQLARQAYSLAHELDPGSETARRSFEGVERKWHEIVAANAVDQGDFELAYRSLAKASELRAFRRRDEVYQLMAEVSNRGEEFERALEAACRATELFPGGLVGRAERAYARGALGDVAGAARDYRRALRGEAVDALPPRLAVDAGRVLASVPADGPAPQPTAEIEAGLRGERLGKIPARLRLRIVAADAPDVFRDHFRDDVATLADAAVGAEAIDVALTRLEEALVVDSAAPLPAVIARADLDPKLRQRAAALLARLDVGLLMGVLEGHTSVDTLAAAVLGATSARDRRVVPVLIERLEHSDVEVRRAAQTALFALSSGTAPGVERLDPGAPATGAYRNAVHDLRAWWARSAESFRFAD